MRFKDTGRKRLAINITPLIDVLFLLVIFVLVMCCSCWLSLCW
ncbi:MAG: ExbD/TolR family protein [Planctomycetota bacterium]